MSQWLITILTSHLDKTFTWFQPLLKSIFIRMLTFYTSVIFHYKDFADWVALVKVLIDDNLC